LTLLADPADYTDPDVEPPNEKKWNTAFRKALADVHRGKIVVYFSFGDKLVFDDGLGHWTVTASTGGSSSWAARYVNMPKGMPEKNLLAHELGHYLHNRHPFVGGVESVADAAEKIRKYVDDQGHSTAAGLEALDGDRSFVLDTPADVGGALLEDLYGDRCGPNGTVDIPVSFENGSKKTYVLAPNRHLIMSYFKGCHDLGHWLSPQQIQRTRDALENGNRQDLVTLSPDHSYVIDRLGSADAGAISAADLVRIGHNRVVAVVITGGNLKLIVWDVGDDGMTILRRGDALAGSVSLVSAVNLGLGMVATAVRLGDGNLKVIVWKVTAGGDVERHGEATAGFVDQISACRLGNQFLATAVRNGGGNLQVILWQINADGSLARKGESSAGKVNEIAAASLGNHGVMTAVRDSQDNLKVIAWQASDDAEDLVRQGSATAGTVGAIASVNLDIDVLTTAVRLPSGVLRVITWRIDEFGVITRRDDADAGSVKEIASARLGTGLLVTACRDGSNNLVLDLWGCQEAGDNLVHKTSDAAGGASQIALARTGTNQFVTALKTNSGDLKLIAWRVRPLVIRLP
jgi:predicted regulator of Ras-like GTPase activity (Roadblock/LC7/MglB family)